jgi:hypothetical protein
MKRVQPFFRSNFQTDKTGGKLYRVTYQIEEDRRDHNGIWQTDAVLLAAPQTQVPFS